MTQYLSNPGLICAGANSAAELFSALCEKRSALQKLSVYGKNFIFGRVDTSLPKIKDRAYATRTNALALYACLGAHGQIEQAVQKFGAPHWRGVCDHQHRRARKLCGIFCLRQRRGKFYLSRRRKLHVV
ncbi:hypothetical protein [uncultured Campylobacter sp.]|uniref:hypothetical protein n=1 Tax=uncultured Campylobacter sp. TaxID=218934 RepID=UPI00261DD737|nr:hypothetical protein [uncultured Campylobacter sp.]